MAGRDRYYVYALIRPDTGRPFYIGKGCGDRWEHHIKSPERQKNKHKASIIRKLGEMGLAPECRILAERLVEEDAYEIEALFIAAIGRGQNGPLVNLTDGGHGVWGLPRSKQHRERISQALAGRPLTGERRKTAVAAAAKGRETVKKLPRQAFVEAARKGLALKPPEKRSEWQRKAWETRCRASPSEVEKLRELGRTTMTPEKQRRAVEAAAARPASERSAKAKKANDSRTPEQRSEITRKSWETRRKNGSMVIGNDNTNLHD